jgi:acetoin utilization deacetylase AcuC-like enzyme
MTTAFYSHPDCRATTWARAIPSARSGSTRSTTHLLATGLTTALSLREAPMAKVDDLDLAHESRYVTELGDALQRIAADGRPRALDADTIAAAGTWAAVMRAAGAAVAATDAVIDGTCENAFCAVRPPGHHATRGQAMGFCFFNNVAVAARHALDVRGLQAGGDHRLRRPPRQRHRGHQSPTTSGC